MSETVFIFGALRSGTTLFRLMLDCHPDLTNPGEVDFLFDYLHDGPSGPAYDLDGLREDRIFQDYGLVIPDGLDGRDLLQDFITQLKAGAGGTLTLNIHRHIDRVLIHMPEARIIHLLRDPRDVARSCIRMGWAGILYFGADQWVKTENGWHDVAGRIPADRVLELKYEDLVTDAPAILADVCVFLNVTYTDRMLDFHETSTYSPVDPKLKEQWRRKSTPEDIALLETRLGPLLERAGYTPSSPDRRSVGMLEASKLWILNKLNWSQFRIRRYGLSLFLADALTRRLGVPFLRRPIHRIMNDRSRNFVK